MVSSITILVMDEFVVTDVVTNADDSILQEIVIVVVSIQIIRILGLNWFCRRASFCSFFFYKHEHSNTY